MRILKYNLLGTGFMGGTHAEAVRRFNHWFSNLADVQIELNCVFNRDAEAGSDFARRFGFKKSSTNMKEVCQDPEADIIDVCLPNHMHPEAVMLGAEAGKDLWIEKPISHDISASQEMADAVGQHRVRTMLWYCYLWTPAVKALHQAILQGRLGPAEGGLEEVRALWQQKWGRVDCCEGRGVWRMNAGVAGKGGVTYDLGAHGVSVVRKMLEYFGLDFTLVQADCRIIVPKRQNAAGTMVPNHATDSFGSLVYFGNEKNPKTANGYLEATRFATGQEAVFDNRFHGTRGAARWDLAEYYQWHLYEDIVPAPYGITSPSEAESWDKIPGNLRGWRKVSAWGGDFHYTDRVFVPGLPPDYGLYFTAGMLEFILHHYPSEDQGQWDEATSSLYGGRRETPYFPDIFDAMQTDLVCNAFEKSSQLSAEGKPSWVEVERASFNHGHFDSYVERLGWT